MPGVSRWSKQFKKEFEGKIIPFGALITCVPVARHHKYEAAGDQCLFLGWNFRPGLAFAKDYDVISLDSILSGTYDVNSVHKTRDIREVPGPWQFPCRDLINKALTQKLVSQVQLTQSDFGQLLEIFGENEPLPAAPDVPLEVEDAAPEVLDGRDLPGYVPPRRGSARPVHVHQNLCASASPAQRRAEIQRAAEMPPRPAPPPADDQRLQGVQAVQDVIAAVGRMFATALGAPSAPSASSQASTAPSASTPAAAPDELDYGRIELPPLAEAYTESQPHRHRDREPDVPVTFSLITRQLSKKDKEWQTPKGQAAIFDEVSNLVNKGVLASTVRERDAVVAEHGADCHFAALMIILGIKFSEPGVSQWKFKARCVLRGDDVRSSDGSPAFFSDTGSSPTTMETVRSVALFSAMCGDEATAADAVAAYLQCPLRPEDGPPTFVAFN